MVAESDKSSKRIKCIERLVRERSTGVGMGLVV